MIAHLIRRILSTLSPGGARSPNAGGAGSAEQGQRTAGPGPGPGPAPIAEALSRPKFEQRTRGGPGAGTPPARGPARPDGAHTAGPGPRERSLPRGWGGAAAVVGPRPPPRAAPSGSRCPGPGAFVPSLRNPTSSGRRSCRAPPRPPQAWRPLASSALRNQAASLPLSPPSLPGFLLCAK